MPTVLRFVLLISLVAPAGAHAGEEVLAGRSISTTTTIHDWQPFFGGDMRELVGHASTTTYQDAEATQPVTVAGIKLDLVALSPVYTESLVRTITRQGDPDVGLIRVESISTTSRGEVTRTSFTLRQRSLDEPIVIGPLKGIEVTPPPREQVIAGKTLVFRSVTRNKEISALMITPTFEDLLAGRNIREIREPGARLESGSLRVLAPDGRPIGFFAGDVRIAHGEDYVRAKE